MNLFPLLFAILAILAGAVIVAVWPGMDAAFKRLLYIVIAIVVFVCIVAVFWPLMAGHMTVGK